MFLEEINPHEALIFKSNFNFDSKHLSAAKQILQESISNSHLEKGDAYSSVGNQRNPPHNHCDFNDYFQWQNRLAEDIIINKYKLAKDLEYSIGNSWVNVHKNSGETLAHSHGISVLSCVGYISADENTGFIEFKDPYYDFRCLHERSDLDKGLKEWSPVRIKTGDVLFFPGWMQHRSQINFSDNDRWVVSSNYINFVLKRPLTLANIANFS